MTDISGAFRRLSALTLLDLCLSLPASWDSVDKFELFLLVLGFTSDLSPEFFRPFPNAVRDSEFVFANVGRLHPDKDQRTLIDAFARVAAELPGHLSPEQQFVMRFPNQRKISSMSGAALAAAISAAAEQAAEESRKLGRDPAVN